MSETEQGTVILPTTPATVIVIRYPDDPAEFFVRRFDEDANDGYLWLGLNYGARYTEELLGQVASTPGNTWAIYASPVVTG
jgi:hypothetical protein